MRRAGLIALLALALALALALLSACGGGSQKRTTPASLAGAIQSASNPSVSDFPAAGGRNVFAIQRLLSGSAVVGLGTSGGTVGTSRLAFGMIDTANRFIYGPAAIYLASSPTAPVQGPFPAPLDSMQVEPRFQSRTVAGDPAAIKGIYEAEVPFAKPGVYAILGVVRVNGRLVGSITQAQVSASSPIPTVGQAPPRIHTPTVAAAHGDPASIDTRAPHDDMHRVDFASVIGRRPVVLLFATPLLHESAGP